MRPPQLRSSDSRTAKRSLARGTSVLPILAMAQPKFDFSQLSPEERIQLAEDPWDSLREWRASALLSEA